ncbi:MAG: hypothetical protein HFJ17_00600 [Clostridia bacterium]|nr:hypothetical protein [Clostridia bacterium]
MSFLKFFRKSRKFKGKYVNHCPECGCSCTCNRECNGNHKMCTSSMKECNHHCGCYIAPLAKKIRSDEQKQRN